MPGSLSFLSVVDLGETLFALLVCSPSLSFSR